MNRRFIPLALGSAALAISLVGCVPNGGGTSPDETRTVLTVDSSASACDVSAAEAPSGAVVFEVTNSGDEVTEFYLLADDGKRIVSEAENIGPGTERDLVVILEAGDYFTACKPGMSGEHVGETSFTVTP